MKYRLGLVFAALLLVSFPSGVIGEAGSESNQLRERERKIDSIRKTGEREKVNYWGTGIPVFNGNGTSLNPEQEKTILAIMDDFQVNTDSGTAAQLNPAVAMDGSGRFVITWQDTRNGNNDIYTQRYNSAGAPQGSNFKVNDDAGTAAQVFPAIAMDDSGNFVITWADMRNGNWDVYAQCYNSAGTPQGSNFKVNDDAGTAAQAVPDIATNGSGNFVITWADMRNGIDHADIYAQRYDSAGTPQDSNFQVNPFTGSWGSYPAVAMGGSGNFIITWQDTRNGNNDIYAQRYNSAGATLGSDFKVNTDIGNAWQTWSDIAMDDSGNFVITWQDNRNGDDDVYAQRYNSAGIPQDSNFMVNAVTTYTQGTPAVAMDGSGRFVITWQDTRSATYDIYAQRYNSAGTPQDSNFKVNDDAGTADQVYPAISMDGSGNFVITWVDGRNSNSDIYAKVVTWPTICGDANGDLKVSVSDVVYLINYLFKGGTAPLCPPAPYLACGDASGDGKVTVSDVVYLINYLFKGGPPPC